MRILAHRLNSPTHATLEDLVMDLARWGPLLGRKSLKVGG
jgi:hypothetical protein